MKKISACPEEPRLDGENCSMNPCTGFEPTYCQGSGINVLAAVPHHSMERPIPPHGDSHNPPGLKAGKRFETRQKNSLPPEVRRKIHDANNVITGIKLSLDMALRCLDGLCDEHGKLTDNPSTQDLYNLLQNGVEATDTLTGILRSRHLESDIKTRVNVCETLTHGLKIVEAECASKNIKIEIDVKGNFYVMAYSDIELIRLFDNVLQNSIDAIERAGRRSGKIKVDLYRDEDKIIIVVEDNGTGLNGDFSYPGQKSSKEGKDHGLGLITVRDIVQKLNGNFTLMNNEQTQGAFAILVLPAVSSIE